ncbi:MAG: FmdB family zinc ribbon protein [Brevefilum sp.]
MPIYEYVCQDCKGEFELMRSFEDADSMATCAHCQSQQTKRKLSLFNASSSGRAITGTSGCGSCAGGSCSSCGSH